MIEKIKDWNSFCFEHKEEVPYDRFLKMLTYPRNQVDVVIDSDAYNEIDDQFAIAYLIKSKEKIRVKAIYAVPFYNERSDSPEDGMLKSYEEINKLLHIMEGDEREVTTFYGSNRFLSSEFKEVQSAAASDLACRAMSYSADNPLYVVAIGALTNIASAILINSQIIDNIVVIWLGGNAHHWIHNREFNCYEDVAAARVVFNSQVAIVHIPCMGVASGFTVSQIEFDQYLKNKNTLCDYLLSHTIRVGNMESKHSYWSRIVWDVTAAGWLINDNFTWSYLTEIPIPEYDNRYTFSKTRHIYRYVYFINRDSLLTDLVSKLTS